MSSSEILPQELFDYTIDFLHDDYKSLQACALVCNAWVPTSRYHIFHDVTLSGPWRHGGITKCARLFQAIEKTPIIASCISQLTILEASPRAGFPWVAIERRLPRLLKRLTHLRKLTISVPVEAWKNEAYIWPAETLPPIISAISSLPLEEVTLQGVFLPGGPIDLMRMLKTCSHLKVLHLESLKMVDAATGISPNNVFSNGSEEFSEVYARAEPEEITMDSEWSSLILGCFKHELSPLRADKLSHLCLQIAGDFTSFSDYLRSATALQHLEIQLTNKVNFETDWTHSNSFDLSCNPSLRFLNLEVEIMLNRQDPLPWLHSLLSTLPTKNQLEEMSLLCTIDMPPPFMTQEVYDSSLSGWRKFDALLSGSKFSKLKRLRLDFNLVNPIDDRVVPSILLDFLHQLRALNDRGIMEVDSCEVR